MLTTERVDGEGREEAPPRGRLQRLISHPRIERARRWAPAVAFLGGFAWDALTLGRVVRSSDLWLIFGYYVCAAVIMILRGRGLRFRFNDALDWVLQFLFGSIFSALFIFYFLSSSALPGYIVVTILLALLVGNEFLEKRYQNLTLTWTFFLVCGAMFLNFALPHLFHSISRYWFYVSTGASLAVVAGMRKLSTLEEPSIKPSVGVAAALVIAHAFNVIPPVPLVKREMVVAHEVVRRGSSYELTIEPAPFWRPGPRSAPVVHRSRGERIYCFTSVFIPSNIETSIRHRWEMYDERSDRWITTSVISFPIRGGRREGYRGYTWKRNVAPGLWRVTAESTRGDAIGVLKFRVEDAERAARTKKLVR